MNEKLVCELSLIHFDDPSILERKRFFIYVTDYNEISSSFLYEPIWKRCRFRSRCEWALRLIYITVA